MPKNAEFVCEKCQFKTSKKSNFDIHLMTLKHKMETMETNEVTEKMPNLYQCNCGMKYTSRNGLWKHKKKCNENEVDTKESIVMDSDSVSMSVSEKELLHKMVESNEAKNEMIIELQKQLIESLNKPSTVNHLL